ncbi:MAG: hypothetical protein GQE15_03325 [Archangiaceae bacterium]|nr:hypothetical protein [Archangiaceae bacterium]
MVRITPDVGRNFLLLEISGRPVTADLATAEAQVREAITRLRAPFDVLSDVRGLESLDDLPAADAKRLGELLARAKVRRVVRVVGKSSTAAIQMERVARSLGHSAHLAFSREEAEALLAQR